MLFVASQSIAQTIPEKTNKFINDYANVLLDDEEERLKSVCDMIFQESTSQVAVIITNDLDENSSIEEFALNTFHSWGIGQNGVDNGVLIVVAPNIRKSRIEVGYGLEGILTDLYTKRLQVEHFRPNFKNNDYYTGIGEALIEIKKQISPEAIELARQEKIQSEKEAKEAAAAVGNFLLNFLLFLAIAGSIGYGIYYSIKKKREKERIEREEKERLERIEREKKYKEEQIERNAANAKASFESLCNNALTVLHQMDNFQNSEQLISNIKDFKDTTLTRLKFKKNEEYPLICSDGSKEIQQLIAEIQKNFEIKKKVEKNAKSYKTTNFDNSLRRVYDDVLRMNIRLHEYNINTTIPNHSYETILNDIVLKSDKALELLKLSEFVKANSEISKIEKIVTDLNNLHSSASSNTETLNKSINFLNNDADRKFAEFVKSAKAKFADSDMINSSLKREWTNYITNLIFKIDKSANPLEEFKRISNILTKVIDYRDKADSVITAEENKRRKKKEEEEAEERRRRKKKEDDEEDDRRRRNSYSSSYSSYSSSYDSSSSSSDSSSSFGGGDSGGGGSSDSW